MRYCAMEARIKDFVEDVRGLLDDMAATIQARVESRINDIDLSTGVVYDRMIVAQRGMNAFAAHRVARGLARRL